MAGFALHGSDGETAGEVALGYMTRKGGCWYVVIYEGLDPATGRERRRWHAARTDRAVAEPSSQPAADEHERRGTGRSHLTLAGRVERTWLLRKQRQLLAWGLLVGTLTVEVVAVAPNPELVGEPEAVLVINTVPTILNYLDTKFRHPSAIS